MKERPILFSAPMVRALLDGSKTQTRRIVKLKHRAEDATVAGAFKRPEWLSTCPYGQPGDRLWVRETHRPIFGQSCGLIAIDYRADSEEKGERMPDHAGRPKWTPSIHMRREYSRVQLEIVAVRVERLQDISEADAQAEGVDPATCVHHFYNGFAKLWTGINGPGSWDANPWVWVVEFRRVAAC